MVVLMLMMSVLMFMMIRVVNELAEMKKTDDGLRTPILRNFNRVHELRLRQRPLVDIDITPRHLDFDDEVDNNIHIIEDTDDD
jgi:hypothetical protein